VVTPIGAALFLVILVGTIAAVVAMTIAARRIPIQIPRKVMGRGRIREGQKTFIPIRLITAGVMPIIFAQTIIIVPGTIASFTQNPVLTELASFFQPGDLPYDVVFGLLILVFSYFYTSIIFNSVDLAENLKKQGGFIPGVKPGASTADYIDSGLEVDEHPQQGLRRYLGPDRCRRSPRHHRSGRAAPDAAQVRRLHEDWAGQVPGSTAAVHVGNCRLLAIGYGLFRARSSP